MISHQDWRICYKQNSRTRVERYFLIQAWNDQTFWQAQSRIVQIKKEPKLPERESKKTHYTQHITQTTEDKKQCSVRNWYNIFETVGSGHVCKGEWLRKVFDKT